MTPGEIAGQLERILTERNPVHYCYLLVERWNTDAVTPDQVADEILRFMEEHTDVDLGLPGPLIRFMEQAIAEESYQDSLVRSIQRKPVPYTIWMSERLLKVTADPARRSRIIRAMRSAKQNPHATPDLQAEIDQAIS
ncbi:MAG: hypothetical protein ABSG84_14135 [Acidobacteriaceae bacterium]|jgi:hypothetical protein